MQRLKDALEALDDIISDLEDKVSHENGGRQELTKKQVETLKLSRTREANVLAMAQKVASRLDQAIQHVEHVLRD